MNDELEVKRKEKRDKNLEPRTNLPAAGRERVVSERVIP
jgi:hypothetical protein